MAWAIIGVVLLIVLVALFAFGWWLSGIVVTPKPWAPLQQMRKQEFDLYGIADADWEHNWHREEFSLPSQFGYSLHCVLIPRKPQDVPKDGRERVIVIVHGYTASHYCSVKYANMFRDLGFNAVLYDQRHHGTSGQALTTMGYYESRDLCTVCAWARERFGKDCVLGTHGESMGAATVMMHSGMDQNLAFVVEDCGYSDLKEQLAYVMRTRYHLPDKIFIPLAFFVARLRTGLWFQKIHPADGVANSGKTPVLFVHGEADTFVPYSMLAKNVAAKTTGNKRVLSVPGAEHALSFQKAPELYRKTVREFLIENKVLEA